MVEENLVLEKERGPATNDPSPKNEINFVFQSVLNPFRL
jgi:hypothetical protein